LGVSRVVESKMALRGYCVLLLAWTSAALPPIMRAQAPPMTPPPISVTSLDFSHDRLWTIFGRVTTPYGEPVRGALVRVEVGAPGQPVRTLDTNLQGDFKTQYVLDGRSYNKLSVTVTATMTGYLEARETTEFRDDEGTRQIRLVLREQTADPDLLPLASLVANLAPRLRAAAAGGLASAATQKDYQRGVEQYLDKHNAASAIPLLSRVVEREPN